MSRRTVPDVLHNAGKSPSDAGRLGGLSGGRVTLSGAHRRVNAFRHESALPGHHPGLTAPSRWYRCPRTKRRIPLVAPDQEFPPSPSPSAGAPTDPRRDRRRDRRHPRWRAVSHSGPPHATWCPGCNRLSAPALRQPEQSRERAPPVDILDLPHGAHARHEECVLPALHHRDTAMTFPPDPYPPSAAAFRIARRSGPPAPRNASGVRLPA